jgi:hypothetical protein
LTLKEENFNLQEETMLQEQRARLDKLDGLDKETTQSGSSNVTTRNTCVREQELRAQLLEAQRIREQLRTENDRMQSLQRQQMEKDKKLQVEEMTKTLLRTPPSHRSLSRIQEDKSPLSSTLSSRLSDTAVSSVTCFGEENGQDPLQNVGLLSTSGDMSIPLPQRKKRVGKAKFPQEGHEAARRDSTSPIPVSDDDMNEEDVECLDDDLKRAVEQAARIARARVIYCAKMK